MTATGRAASRPAGTSTMSCQGMNARAGDVTGVPLGALANVEDLQLGVGCRGARTAPRRSGARSVTPDGVPGASWSCRRRAGRRCCERRRRWRARAARLPSASSRPMNTISWSWSASQASFEPKPELNEGMQIEPRMWTSSNCRSVRTSTSSAPSSRLSST